MQKHSIPQNWELKQKKVAKKLRFIVKKPAKICADLRRN